MSYSLLLNTLMKVWELTNAQDGAGGDTTTYTLTRTIKGRIDTRIIDMLRKEQGVVQDVDTMIFVGPGVTIPNNSVMVESGGEARCYRVVSSGRVDGRSVEHHREIRAKLLEQLPAGVS